MFGIDRMRHALLIQRAPGKHRDREVAPTEKDVSDDRRTPHPENPDNPVNPASDNRKRGQAHQPAHNLQRRGCKPRLLGIYGGFYEICVFMCVFLACRRSRCNR